MRANLCECGCGDVANAGKRFISGHNMQRGKVVFTLEHRRRISEAVRGSVRSEETRRRISLAKKGSVPWNLGKTASAETKHRLSESHKGHVPSLESRRKLAASLSRAKLGVKQGPRTEATKRKISATLMGRRMSKAAITKMKETWADPTQKSRRVRAILRAQNRRPNGPETSVLNLLVAAYPGEWKYVGDGSVVLGGKNPDFINVNGKKLIIELFGDYWHQGQDPRERAAVFKPFGFRTLVIWERELARPATVLRKIKRFQEGV